MKKGNLITLLFSIITGIGFVVFSRSGLLRKVPGFQCEGFGCIGNGITEIFIGAILIPLIFAILAFAFSRERRITQAFSSLGISLLIMLLSFWVINLLVKAQVGADTERGIQATEELYKQNNIPNSQLSQDLPLLDSGRAITIANQLNNSTIVTKSPFAVQAYAQEAAILADGSLQSKIMVFVPGSIERKDVAVGKLSKTQNRSTDGRIIFEGTLSLGDTFGAIEGYLSVIGRDGVTDTVRVTFK